MLPPITVKIIPIAMMIASRLITWIVTKVRFAILELMIDSCPRDKHF